MAKDPIKDAAGEDPDARIARLEALIADLVAKQAAPGGDSALALQMATILERVTGNSVQAAELIEKAKRTEVRPSNVVSHNRSVFNLRGELLDDYAKPKLKCEMHIPYRAEDDMLTREEVELLNLLVDCPGLWVIRRNDDTKVKVTVKREMNEDESKVTKVILSHDTAFRNEYFRTLPPLTRMLRQMLEQGPQAKAARAVLTMDEEQALIDAGELTVSV